MTAAKIPFESFYNAIKNDLALTNDIVENKEDE